ncbi:MAG: glycosyltransferase [Cytophagaceae bacterium]|nr:glycosyltransferase [Cytophagaceae bacterium]
MIYIFLILTTLYVLFVLVLLMGWVSIPRFITDKTSDKTTFISVVIAVRNEEAGILHLLKDLELQSYPLRKFEVIVADDHSTDHTAALVKSFSDRSELQVKLLSLSAMNGASGKKKAIEKAIEEAQGDLIITTDGDCTVGPDWINAIQDFYIKNKATMIIGPVTFIEKENLFTQIQKIEFASLIGSGAACLQLGIPNMCNGANLAFEKKAFYEVKGYEGNEAVPSGDDEFLMHKISAAFPGKVVFLKGKEAIVYTPAIQTLKDFKNQRVRWASKWSFYKVINIKVLAVFIFLINFSIPLFFVFCLCGLLPEVLFAEQLLIKMIVEFVFLNRVSLFLGGRIKFIPFLILQVIYPLYVIYFALAGLRGCYEWKGRTLNNVKF